MKKSIFLFFAAILCAMSVNAKTVYLKAGQWTDGEAKFGCHTWGSSDKSGFMTHVEGDVYKFETLDANTDVIFTRVASGATGIWDQEWDRVQTTFQSGKDMFVITDWKAGKWDVYAPAVTHTFTKNSTLYIDFRNITDASKRGANYPKAGTASGLDYSANAGGTVIPVTFTADVKWAEGAEFMKTEKGGWASIPFKAPEAGQNCAQVAADGKSYTWTTYSEPSVTLSLDKTEADAGTEVTVTLTATADNVSGEVTYAFQYSTDNATWSNITATGNTATQTFAAETRYYKVTMTNGGTTKEATAKFSAIKFHVIGSWDDWAAHNEVVEGSKTITLEANKTYDYKITNGTWDLSWGNDGTMTRENCTNWSFEASGNAKITTDEAGDYVFNVSRNGEGKVVVSVTYPELVTPIPTFDYYIVGSFNGNNPKKAENGMTLDGTVYKATVTLAEGDNTLKVTQGSWDPTWGYSNLGAAYEEVSDAGEYNNIKITLAAEAEKNITVIFNATTGKITFGGLTELPPAEPVTVYFINSGEWAEVACYYWGGLNGSAWPGVQMTATGETYEAEGWNVYTITFPGDNTKCIFTDNKAEGTTQTGDLEVQDGKYYCYANGIWYERLADVDPLDTRVYLKGDMNEWCTTEGWCDMFRKETVDGTVAYRTTWLEAETTYEFKIEDAGTWLSNESTMDKDNCTGWEFTEGANNAKITTEYAGDYTFVWDMTTKKLSVVYPELTPEVMDLMVTDMVFDGDGTFSGTDNMMGIEFALVVGSELEDGVYSLDASSTVNFGGTLFTDVTGMIAPDTETFASASAVVYGFYMGMYFQLNVEMSAGGSAGVPVEILDGTASVDDATGELTISATWEGDDIYVKAPGFNGESYECDEAWFYVGGTNWETASIIAFGPVTITVDGNDVLVEGTVMSGMTGTNYDLSVIGTFPAAVTTIDVTLSGMQKGQISRVNKRGYIALEDGAGNNLQIYNESAEWAYGEYTVTGELVEYGVTVQGTGIWDLVDGVETLTATLQVEDDNTTIYNVVATVGAATTITLECWDATYTITDPELNEVTFTGIADGKEFTIVVAPEGAGYYSDGEWDGTPILGTSVEFDDSDAEKYYLGGTYIDDASNTYEVAIFGAPAVVEPTPDYTRTVTLGNYGTICLPFGSTNYTGMELYEFVGKEESSKAYIASVTTLEAGVPYIFRATANELVVYSDGTTAATPGTHNGLHGTFTDNTEVAVDNYILYNNAICVVTATCWVNANRAYIVWDEIPTGAPQQMPGRKYIGMDVTGENEATGFENITNGENTTIKVIENGQLIIIRNGEKFNAQGQKL